MDRPPNISEADWARMPWYARERAARRIASTTRAATDAMPRVPVGKRRPRRIRVHCVEPGCWEITNGVTTARTATAEAAWRLLDHLGRTA